MRTVPNGLDSAETTVPVGAVVVVVLDDAAAGSAVAVPQRAITNAKKRTPRTCARASRAVCLMLGKSRLCMCMVPFTQTYAAGNRGRALPTQWCQHPTPGGANARRGRSDLLDAQEL